MRVVLVACAVLLGVATNGCSCSQRHTPGDDGDGGARDAAPHDGPRDGQLPDRGTVTPDGSLPWDAGTCEQPWYWERTTRAIHSLGFANGAPPRLGVTEQLLVGVQLLSGSCEALAGVEAAIMPGNATDFIELTAWVWRVAGSVPCTPDAPIVSTVVLVPGRGQGNLRVVVADATTTPGGVSLTYQREMCSGMPDCQCYPGSPAGSGQEFATCLTDCSCAAGLSCIGAIDFVGEAWHCRRPCADDYDCRPGETCAKYVADSAAWVCESWGGCQDAGDCGEGFTCEPDASGALVCVDRRPVPTMQDCTCDAQCPPGQRCSRVWGNETQCAVWCQDDADCPAAGQSWLVCGTPQVCLPLE
jgi:hypothetical protein